jgi:hypothetical protein
MMDANISCLYPDLGRANPFGIVPSATADKCSAMPHHERPHHVYMSFFQMDGWQIQFLDTDLETSLPLKLAVAGPENLRELARQGDAMRTPEARRTLE